MADNRNVKRQTRAERYAQQQELARLEALQAAKERKQQTIIGAVVVAILVVIAVFVGFMIFRNTFLQGQIAAENEKKAYAALQEVKVKPKRVDDKGGILFSKNGYGKKIDNVPTVAVYMDALCPGCGDFNRRTDPILKRLLDAGQINLDLHPMSFLDQGSSDKYSTRAAAAMLYIADHDDNPEHLLQYITNIYSEKFQPHEAQYYKPVSNKALEDQAIAAGVSKDVAHNAFGNTYHQWLEAASKYSALRESLKNVQGSFKGNVTTPTITINDHFLDPVEMGKQHLNYEQAIIKAIGLDENNIGNAAVLPKLHGNDKPFALS